MSKGGGFRVDPDALSRAADQLHAHADEVEGHGRTLAAKTGGRVGHGPVGQVAEDLVKRGIRGVSEGVSKAVADFHRGTAKGLKAAATRTREADAHAARSFKDLDHAGRSVPRPAPYLPHLPKGDSAAIASLPQAKVGWTEDFNYRRTFAKAHPDVTNVWVHHAVPQKVLTRYPGLFKPQEIHSAENLAGVPGGKINQDIHLSEIRRSWDDFYKTHAAPSRQDVLDHATKIYLKVGVFFSPSVT
jgi:hypothetical protein